LVPPKPKAASRNTSNNKKPVEKENQNNEAPEKPAKKNEDKKEKEIIAPNQTPKKENPQQITTKIRL
jgi:hypothetical protein